MVELLPNPCSPAPEIPSSAQRPPPQPALAVSANSRIREPTNHSSAIRPSALKGIRFSPNEWANHQRADGLIYTLAEHYQSSAQSQRDRSAERPAPTGASSVYLSIGDCSAGRPVQVDDSNFLLYVLFRKVKKPAGSIMVGQRKGLVRHDVFVIFEWIARSGLACGSAALREPAGRFGPGEFR